MSSPKPSRRSIAAFTASAAIRRVAFLLITFGGGLGWVLMLAGQPNWLGSPPLDLILPEGFTFLVLYAMPHIALARTLDAYNNGGLTEGC